MTIGLLHPGEMGAAIGEALRASGQTVLWASAGRGAVTAERADGAGLEDVGSIEELSRRSDVILSVCRSRSLRRRQSPADPVIPQR
jgi:3-hydroxyisobutyrate dehydrogenase-like beta-hydroxyacid dehydrogenase